MYRGKEPSLREYDLKQAQKLGERSNRRTSFHLNHPILKGIGVFLGVILFLVIMYFLSILLFTLIGL